MYADLSLSLSFVLYLTLLLSLSFFCVAHLRATPLIHALFFFFFLFFSSIPFWSVTHVLFSLSLSMFLFSVYLFFVISSHVPSLNRRWVLVKGASAASPSASMTISVRVCVSGCVCVRARQFFFLSFSTLMCFLSSQSVAHPRLRYEGENKCTRKTGFCFLFLAVCFYLFSFIFPVFFCCSSQLRLSCVRSTKFEATDFAPQVPFVEEHVD